MASWKARTRLSSALMPLIAATNHTRDDSASRGQTIKAGLKDGSFSIWKGPILGQDGKEVVKKDTVADDKFLLGINFYVKGVEGKVPSGK